MFIDLPFCKYVCPVFSSSEIWFISKRLIAMTINIICITEITSLSVVS